MFDAYLRDRATRRGEKFVPFDAGRRLRRVRRRQAAGRRRARRSSPSRGIELPEGSADDPPDARDGGRPRQPQERARARADQARRRRGLRGLGPLRQGRARGRPADARWSRPAPTAATCSRPPASTTCSTRGSTASSPTASTCTASRHRTRSWPAPGPSASSPTQAVVFEDALAGVAAGRAGKFGYVVGVDRVEPGRGAARARRRHRRRRPRRTARPHDRASCLRRSSRGSCGRPSSTSDLLAQTESVFALVQRPHRAARQPRRGRAARAARAPTSTASTRAGRCRTRRPATATPRPAQTVVNVTNGKIIRLLVDDEPFDMRYGDRCSHERTLDLRGRQCCAASVDWCSPTGQRRARPLDPARLASPSGRSPRSSYEVEPLDGDDPRRHPVRARGQRAAPSESDDPRAAAALERPLQSARSTAPAAAGPCSSTRRGRAGCGWRRRWTTSSTGRPRHRDARRGDVARHGAGHRSRHGSRAGERLRLVKFLAYGWSSERSTPAVRDQVGAALAEARHTGWEGLLRRAARLPRRVLGRRRRRARRRRGAPAGGPLRPLPRPAGRRARRAAGDRRQGPDRARLRRARLLGHRDVRAARAHLHRPAAGRRRACAGGTARCRPPGERAAQLGLQGAAFPWRTISGARVLGLLAGRHGGLPHQRRHRRRRPSLRGTPPATTDFDRGRRHRAAGRDGPAVAVARPPRRRTAASASTA